HVKSVHGIVTFSLISEDKRTSAKPTDEDALKKGSMITQQVLKEIAITKGEKITVKELKRLDEKKKREKELNIKKMCENRNHRKPLIRRRFNKLKKDILDDAFNSAEFWQPFIDVEVIGGTNDTKICGPFLGITYEIALKMNAKTTISGNHEEYYEMMANMSTNFALSPLPPLTVFMNNVLLTYLEFKTPYDVIDSLQDLAQRDIKFGTFEDDPGFDYLNSPHEPYYNQFKGRVVREKSGNINKQKWEQLVFDNITNGVYALVTDQPFNDYYYATKLSQYPNLYRSQFNSLVLPYFLALSKHNTRNFTNCVNYIIGSLSESGIYEYWVRNTLEINNEALRLGIIESKGKYQFSSLEVKRYRRPNRYDHLICKQKNYGIGITSSAVLNYSGDVCKTYCRVVNRAERTASFTEHNTLNNIVCGPTGARCTDGVCITSGSTAIGSVPSDGTSGDRRIGRPLNTVDGKRKPRPGRKGSTNRQKTSTFSPIEGSDLSDTEFTTSDVIVNENSDSIRAKIIYPQD
ncbi:unnamed protein product, partial [Medioppia subpectinata]